MKNLIIIFLTLVVSISTYASNGKVLIVVSAAGYLDLKNGGTVESGYFVSELAETMRQLEHNNIEFDIATPDGVAPVIDGYGLQMYFYKLAVTSNWPKDVIRLNARAKEERAKDIQTAMKHFGRLKFSNRYANEEVGKFLDDIEYEMNARELIEKPMLVLESLAHDARLADYDGLYIPGGHAPKTDLLYNESLGFILKHFNNQQKTTAIICHAPILLLTTMDGVYDPFTPLTQLQKDSLIYKGYNITLGNKSEEVILENFLYLRGSKLQFYVGEKAREAGLKLSTARLPSMSQVVEDRELITGANPASVYKLTEKFIARLKTQ